MIYSMTAFARAEHQTETGCFVCELRSINHRYLEVSTHLPDFLRALEMPIREHIRQSVRRGKIECGLRYQANPKSIQSQMAVNMQLAEAISQASERIATKIPHPGLVNPLDILRFPGVIETKEIDLNQVQTDVLNVLGQALTGLVAARGREGEELKRLFVDRLVAMEKELAKVRSRLPMVMNEANERLIKRFSEAKVELEPNRLAQEMVIFAQKIDIAEEIERAETHIAEFRRILEHESLVGRRLDFLLQELNREANTLGSKSADPVITHAAVEMKVLIEQIREQVQNVE